MLLISLSLFGLTACNGGTNTTYEQITAKEAKEIMNTEKDYIIIDARTEEEFAEGHIENAILIPEYEIKDRAEKETPFRTSFLPYFLCISFITISINSLLKDMALRNLSAVFLLIYTSCHYLSEIFIIGVVIRIIL